MDTESIEEEVEDHLKEAAENQQKQQHTHLSHGSFASDGSKRFSSDSMTGIRSGMGMDVEKGSIHLESLRHASDPKMLESVPMVQPKVDKSRQKAIVRIEIHDTGVGLKKNDLDDSRLFSPYVQTEIGRRQGGKGSGLGLALVRQIVRLSNGRLGVDSEYGKGSVFWFELPYAIPPPSRKKTPMSIMGGASPHPSRPPLMTSAMAVPTIDEESMTSPAVEKDDPLDRIEHRGSDAMPLEPRPQGLPGSGQVGGQGQERPKLQETESTMPLLNRTPSGRIRRESVPTETVIVTTYPPPDSNSSSDSSFEGLAAEVIASTPQVEFEQRRESDWSTSVAESSRKGSEQPLLPGPGPGSNAGRQGRLPSVDDEPPLCAFVVDDDRLTRMLMSRMLTRLGHQVTNAENGKIALQMIKDSQEGKPGVPKFDVCFLDNQMPFMSGVEVVRALREMGNPLYVVGCTGNALREDQDEYLSAGADGIIPKPVHQKSVLEQIKEARKRIAGKTKPKAIQPSY